MARSPLSPEAAAVVRAMSGGRLSRRRFLAGAGWLGTAAVLGACGSSPGGGGTASRTPSPGRDVSDTDRVVRWASRALYLDRDEAGTTFPTLTAFETKTGITPSYLEEIEDVESYAATMSDRMRGGQDLRRDLVLLRDWMTRRAVRAGWVAKLDRGRNIPNAANILGRLANVDYDPGRQYSLTWQSGLTGLGWNVAEYRKLTRRTQLRSLDDLWNPALKGRVGVLTEMRDTMGLILLAQGVDPARPFGRDRFENAVALLRKQLSAGQIRQVSGNSYVQDLAAGDVVAVIGWSGDILQLNAAARAAGGTPGHDPYGFALPESGGMLWNDDLVVPLGATHRTNAEILLNYYYDPTVAAQVAAHVRYLCPVKGAQAAMRRLPDVDPALAADPLVFPRDADLKRAHRFRSLSDTEERDFEALFRASTGT